MAKKKSVGNDTALKSFARTGKNPANPATSPLKFGDSNSPSPADVVIALVEVRCPTVDHPCYAAMNDAQNRHFAAYHSTHTKLVEEYSEMSQRPFTHDAEHQTHADKYHYITDGLMREICNFHMALNSGGNTAKDSLRAAILLHQGCRLPSLKGDIDSVRTNYPKMAVASVFGHQSHGWHEGVLFWADAHAAMLERTAGFLPPQQGKMTVSYPTSWDSAVLHAIWRELDSESLKPFTDTILGSDEPEIGDGDEPPAALIHELTPQSATILRFLWNRNRSRVTNWSSLPNGCWRDERPTIDQETRTVEAALQRLQQSLGTKELAGFAVTLEVHSRGKTTKLVRSSTHK